MNVFVPITFTLLFAVAIWCVVVNQIVMKALSPQPMPDITGASRLANPKAKLKEGQANE